jgi:hypothetical protein
MSTTKPSCCTGDCQQGRACPAIYLDGPYLNPKQQQRATLRRKVLAILLALAVLGMSSAVLGFTAGYFNFHL